MVKEFKFHLALKGRWRLIMKKLLMAILFSLLCVEE